MLTQKALIDMEGNFSTTYYICSTSDRIRIDLIFKLFVVTLQLVTVDNLYSTFLTISWHAVSQNASRRGVPIKQISLKIISFSILNSSDVQIVFEGWSCIISMNRCCLLEQIYDLWGRTIAMNLMHCGDVLKIETATWKDICIDKKRNDHSYWQSTWKTAEQDKYIMSIYLYRLDRWLKESPHHGPLCTVTRKANDNQTFVQIKQLYRT